MFTDDVFLREILANPADEAPWLIYSDWLGEQGDPRAVLYRRPRFANGMGMKFALVPRGNFWMGHREEQSRVTIEKEFYLAVCPVTQGQWRAVMGSNPSYWSRGSGDSARVAHRTFHERQGEAKRAALVDPIPDTDLLQFPVESVSWIDIQEFIKRVNAQERDRGVVYRLPTEPEWEYGCRGGASSQADCSFDFYTPNPSNDLSSDQANFHGLYPAGNAAKGRYLARTSKVGSYVANRLGLRDMHGNVREWCSGGVIRGGGYLNDAAQCRASNRVSHEWMFRRNVPVRGPTGEYEYVSLRIDPPLRSETASDLGFRLAAVVPGDPVGRA
jgi:uncharacterized protein (TIGR02996 family)